MSIVLVLILFACSSAAQRTFTVSGNPYAPYPDGGYIVYDVYPFTGTWHDNTGELDILTRGAPGVQQTMAFSRTRCAKFPDADLYNAYYHLAGTPNAPAQPWASLQNVDYLYSGKLYIGEGVDQFGAVKIPPEAIITNAPVAGESIDSPSTTVYAGCDSGVVQSSAFHWRYRTIAHYATWGIFPDVWRTSLREYASDNSGYVYNYAWQRGKGIVDLWYGQLNQQTNAVTGSEYYAVASGTNTPTITPTETSTPAPTVTVTGTPDITGTPPPTIEPAFTVILECNAAGCVIKP